MNSRRERFVALYEALDPVGGATALQYFVSRETSDVSSEIAASVASIPASQHFLYSAIGAGKSMELLRARELLAERVPTPFTAWIDPVVIDPDALDQMGKGWLVDWALFAFAKELHGRRMVDNSTLEGILAPLARPPSQRSRGDSGLTREDELKHVIAAAGGRATLFVDSIERCIEFEPLRQMLSHDLLVLARHNVGIVAPRPFSFESTREADVLWKSAEQHFVPAASLESKREREWLRELISKRDPNRLFDNDAIEALVEASGGLPRVLVALARKSARLALHHGEQSITATVVARARAAFAADFSGLLSPAQAAALSRFGESPTYELGEHFWQHVLQGRVLWRPDAPSKATLHPLVRDVLEREAA